MLPLPFRKNQKLDLKHSVLAGVCTVTFLKLFLRDFCKRLVFCVKVCHNIAKRIAARPAIVCCEASDWVGTQPDVEHD